MAALSERRLVALISAVQFVNVLDFMIVMPLGPDFAVALGIPASDLGVINGSYTLAAGAVGILASPYLDRFDRRTSLIYCIFGLVLGTALGGCAQGLLSLIAARILAGACGGPAVSLSYSIVADAIPPHRLGRAMGSVLGTYAIASVFGVPAALQLSQWQNWRTPFFATAALGVGIILAAGAALPQLKGHLGDPHPPMNLWQTLGAMGSRVVVRDALVLAFLLNLMHFMVVPNLAAFVEFNLHYPRARLGLLFFVGGAANFAAMRLLGAFVDRVGATTVGTLGACLSALVALSAFVPSVPWAPVMVFFVAYMVATSCRTVPFNTLMLTIPAAHERAQFMSLQSAIHHLGAAAGAFTGARLLQSLPSQRLMGMTTVGVVSIGLALLTPLFLWRIQTGIQGHEDAHEL